MLRLFMLIMTVMLPFFVQVYASSCNGCVVEGDASAWKKARSLRGAFGEGCREFPDGICEIKCGKANRKGYAKVSLKVTKANGKKVNYGSARVYVGNGGAVTANLKNVYSVTIETDGSFYGEPIYKGARPCCTPNAVWNASVGGSFSGTHYLSIPEWPSMEIGILKVVGLWAQYQGGMCSYFEDYDSMVFSAGRKWTFPASNYSRTPVITYTERSGLFKGSLKVTFGPYCLASAPGQKLPRGKKVSLKVRGVYVGGILSGTVAYRTLSTPIYGE